MASILMEHVLQTWGALPSSSFIPFLLWQHASSHGKTRVWVMTTCIKSWQDYSLEVLINGRSMALSAVLSSSLTGDLQLTLQGLWVMLSRDLITQYIGSGPYKPVFGEALVDLSSWAKWWVQPGDQPCWVFMVLPCVKNKAQVLLGEFWGMTHPQSWSILYTRVHCFCETLWPKHIMILSQWQNLDHLQGLLGSKFNLGLFGFASSLIQKAYSAALLPTPSLLSQGDT